MNKKLWTFICIGLAAVFSITMMYRFYFSQPASFPPNEYVMKEINSLYPEAGANVIQDTILVDQRHVLVPFVSDQDNYSLSYWVWDKRKWRVVSIDTRGEPKIWKIKRNDFSSYHFVWNIHPKDQLSSIDFYLIRDREYQVMDGVESYIPRVQMERSVPLEEKSYGLMSMPGDWFSIINEFKDMESTKQMDVFHDFFPEQQMFFGWIPYNQDGKESFPQHSVNGNSYYLGEINLEHVMIQNKGDMEVSE